MNKKVKKAIKIIASLLGIVFVILAIIAKRTKKDSVYENSPEEKNPMEGKKVIFVESEEDEENADGVKGHLACFCCDCYRNKDRGSRFGFFYTKTCGTEQAIF